MQTATKRGSPPRARRGASPHFFGGSPAGAPARQAGGFGVWGRAGPAPPAPGPSRQVRRWGKGQVRRWGERAGAHGAKRPAGAARGKRVRGAALGKRAGAARGEKGARCGTGQKGRQVRRGGKSRQVPHGGKRVRGAALGEKGRCGAGSGRPFVSREKVPKGPAGPAPSPSRQQGRAGKKGKGGFPFFPALGVPGQCAGDADGAGAAGPRDVRRGQSRRCGVSPKRDAPKGHRAAKKGGRRGRKSAPGALPFSLCGPFGAAAHVFWNFLRRPSDT